jgi:Ca2+/H+ antiporter
MRRRWPAAALRSHPSRSKSAAESLARQEEERQRLQDALKCERMRMAALNAAMANRLQGSVNLALGSAIASIGLTIPAVAVASLALGTPLTLGLSSASLVLLVLTLYISALSLVTGRTTILQGTIHLVIFGVFLLVTVVP